MIKRDIESRDIPFKKINTNRLRLRRFTLSDADSFYKNFSGDFTNLQYFTDYQYNQEQTELLIKQWSYDYNLYGHWRWAITFNEIVIGIIALKISDDNDDRGEISFGIGNSYWGNGLGFEALNAVLDFSINYMNLDSIFAAIDKRNTRAIKLVEKCGMRYSRDIEETRSDACVNFAIYEKNV